MHAGVYAVVVCAAHCIAEHVGRIDPSHKCSEGGWYWKCLKRYLLEARA
jgi:hypothetical protein